MNERKVPVSLSKNDYTFLNYIQQGLFYSGIPISNGFDFSDILKACVLHSALKIFGEWEEYGKQAVGEFLMEVGINDMNLPETNEEFTLISRKTPKNCPMNLERPYIFKNDTFIESMKDLMKKFGTEPMGTGTTREPGVSNLS
jgi:hypothetical protein